MFSMRKCLGVAAVLAAGVLGSGARFAVADSYQLYDLGVANSNAPRGIYADGSVTISGQSYCDGVGGVGAYCYKTYDHGSEISIADAPPPTAYDSGFACSPTLLGYREYGQCNGNYEIVFVSAADPLASLWTPGVYAGAVDDLGLIDATGYGIGTLMVNGKGDVAFQDGALEENYQGYNTTPAPEPGTLVLLLSGCGLGLVGVRRVTG